MILDKDQPKDKFHVVEVVESATNITEDLDNDYLLPLISRHIIITLAIMATLLFFDRMFII